MSSFTYEQIVEAINALPPQDQVKLRKWLNQSAADITPITMRRGAPIATERGIEKEMKWLREHRAEYANQWVALDEDRLISAGLSAKEVHAAAKAAGVPYALIVLVEPPDALSFAGF